MPKNEGFPLYDPSDDPSNKEFIMKDYKGSKGNGKWVSIEDVKDEIADDEDDEDTKEEDDSEEDEYSPEEFYGREKELNETKDIKEYSFSRRGPVDVKTESFHINHDSENILAVTGDGPIETKEPLASSVDDEEFLPGKTFRKSMRLDHLHEDKKLKRKSHDNLKTELPGEKERRFRGPLREMLHSEEPDDPEFEDPLIVPELEEEPDRLIMEKVLRKRIDSSALREARGDINQYFKKDGNLASYHVEDGEEVIVREDGKIIKPEKHHSFKKELQEMVEGDDNLSDEDDSADDEDFGPQHKGINRRFHSNPRKSTYERSDGGRDNLRTELPEAAERRGKGVKQYIRDFFSGHKN